MDSLSRAHRFKRGRDWPLGFGIGLGAEGMKEVEVLDLERLKERDLLWVGEETERR